jgi:hypothetical protein
MEETGHGAAEVEIAVTRLAWHREAGREILEGRYSWRAADAYGSVG